MLCTWLETEYVQRNLSISCWGQEDMILILEITNLNHQKQPKNYGRNKSIYMSFTNFTLSQHKSDKVHKIEENKIQTK